VVRCKAINHPKPATPESLYESCPCLKVRRPCLDILGALAGVGVTFPSCPPWSESLPVCRSVRFSLESYDCIGVGRDCFGLVPLLSLVRRGFRRLYLLVSFVAKQLLLPEKHLGPCSPLFLSPLSRPESFCLYLRCARGRA
jgi:hypothetical protein